MTKTRIAILQNGLIRGGTERFVINLCKGMMTLEVGDSGNDRHWNYDITVINPSLRPEEQVLEPEVIATGAHVVHTTTIMGLRGRISHLCKLYRILRAGRYDAFHTNLDLFNGPNLVAAWLAGVPVRICHAHASMQETELREGRTLAIRVYQRIMRWMCWHFANRHIGCSDAANDFLYKGHDWRKANYPTIIYNGIDLGKYKTAAATDYRFEPELQYILAVGRFVPQKNPGFVLEIMEKMKTLRPDVRLLWVGRGELYDAVYDEAVQKGLSCVRHDDGHGLGKESDAIGCPGGNIEFLGWRDDIPALMQHSRLLLMPSLFEGLSITLIEAQAAGLPCLVSDTVTLQAQCGLIQYKSLSDGAANWAEEISEMIATDAARLNIDAQALERFTITNMAESMRGVIISHS